MNLRENAGNADDHHRDVQFEGALLRHDGIHDRARKMAVEGSSVPSDIKSLSSTT